MNIGKRKSGMRRLFLSKIVSNISIKLKLLLLLLIPMMGIIFFSSSYLIERYKIYREVSYLNNLVKLVVESSALVHEFQKERGLSAGFLGSNGQVFQENLKAQRKITNLRIESLKKNTLLKHSTNRDYIWSNLKELTRIRQQVDSLTIGVKPQITFYTSLNSILIDIIAKTSQQSTRSELTSSLFSYVSFIQSKENSGIERAVLNNTFAKGTFSDNMFVMFVSLMARQEAFMNLFMNSASHNTKNSYKSIMKKDIVEEVERMRRIALTQESQKIIQIQATYWYDTMTNKINLLYQVENEIVKEILGKATKLKDNAYTELTYSSCFVLTILFLILFVSIVIYKNIFLRIETMLFNMGKVTEGDLRVEVNTEGQDEISKLEIKLNDLIKSFQNIIRELKNSTKKLHESSNDLKEYSDVFSNEMNTASKESNSISESAQEMNDSLGSVSASVEEISITINEIAKQASDGSKASKTSNNKALEMHTDIKKLGEYAQNIGSVIDSIVAIATQTNLLALNASIEAASAGDAGKGFGVVASEVKELSVQVANSSHNIKENIKIVQQEIIRNIQAVDLVVETIQDSNNINLSITSSVEEQSIAMKEISEIITKVSFASNKVVRNITEITRIINTEAENALKINKQALVLDELSEKLQKIVKNFQVDNF